MLKGIGNERLQPPRQLGLGEVILVSKLRDWDGLPEERLPILKAWNRLSPFSHRTQHYLGLCNLSTQFQSSTTKNYSSRRKFAHQDAAKPLASFPPHLQTSTPQVLKNSNSCLKPPNTPSCPSTKTDHAFQTSQALSRNDMYVLSPSKLLRPRQNLPPRGQDTANKPPGKPMWPFLVGGTQTPPYLYSHNARKSREPISGPKMEYPPRPYRSPELWMAHQELQCSYRG